MTELKRSVPAAAGIQAVDADDAETRLEKLDQLLGLQSAPTPTSGLSPYTGAWGSKQILHLARRTMFGVKKDDFDFFKTKSMNEMVSILLTPSNNVPAPPINEYTLLNSVSDPEVPSGQTWVNAKFFDAEYIRGISLNRWWHKQMFLQERNIQEKMTLFFHNLLVTSYNDIERGRWAYTNNKTYRANVLGNYRDLIEKTTLDPMMLMYLNGHYNTRWSPDENYARELQELFTLGVNAGYTEDDIKQAAKVLTGFKTTGWSSNPSDTYVYDASIHEPANKTFSSFYNNKVITGGATETEARAELTALLDMIFERNEVAMFICRELYRFFVYYRIDSTVESNVIVPLADTFRNNNYEIKPVLEQLFKSQHFYDSGMNGGVIKSPVDFLIGHCREFEMALPAESNIKQYYGIFDRIRYESIIQAQELTAPPNVAGWPAYYQAPAFHRMWITADILRKRQSFVNNMTGNGFTYDGFKMTDNLIGLTAKFSNPADPNILVNDVLEFLLREDVLPDTKATLKGFLLSGQTSDHYWTSAWNNYVNDPNNTAYRDVVQTRLKNLYRFIMNSSEYQLM